VKRRLLAIVATAAIVALSGCHHLNPTDDHIVCNKRKNPTCWVAQR
jgi:outer membrane protein assembly factor BamE (lipoprotein component of BamABCDE complex)